MSTTYVQTIDTLKLYAERSVQDKDGNQIDTTYAKTSGLATVATTGAYSDLSGTPTIPTATSDLQNDSGFITLADVPAQVNADWDATSGVGEILNKPTIPSVDQTYDSSSTNAQSGTAVAGAIATVNQVPSSTSADQDKVLTVDSLGIPAWAIVPQSPTELFEAAYDITSYSDIRTAITAKKVVYCRVPSGASGYRMAFLAYIGPNNVEFQYYRSMSTHDSTEQGDEVYVYTVASSGWTTNTRRNHIRYKAGTNMTQSYNSSTETLTFSATVPTKTSDLTNDSGFITLSDVPAQVNADWDATSGAGQILNKPSLATVATTGDYSDLTGTPSIPTATSDLTNDSGFITLADVPAQQNADWDATSGVGQILNKPSLATVATTGAYSDLSGKPSIPTATSDLTNDSGFITLSDVPAQVQPDWDATSGLGEILNKPNLATVATTGAYSDLSGKPSIPTATSDLQNDSGFITLSDVPAQVNADWNASSGAAQILNKPTIPAAQVNSDWNAASGVSQILNKPNLATVATTGAYADLSGKPTIPTVDQTYNAASTNAQSGTAVAGAISTKEDAFTVGDGLEMVSSGGVNTLQVEAPVDIVAGTGIAIDNPDGNTMRITNTGFPISATDAVLCGTFKGDPMYTKTYTFTGTVGTSETTISMTIDEKKGTDNINRIWIDPSASFIAYGSAGNNFLPISWRLGSSRQGSVAVLGASTGSLSCRCIDTSSTPIALNITIRYTVSNA